MKIYLIKSRYWLKAGFVFVLLNLLFVLASYFWGVLFPPENPEIRNVVQQSIYIVNYPVLAGAAWVADRFPIARSTLGNRLISGFVFVLLGTYWFFLGALMSLLFKKLCVRDSKR